MNKYNDSTMRAIYAVYGQEDCLKSVDGKQDEKGFKDVKCVFSLLGNETHSEVILNKNNELTKHHCDCNWYKDYDYCVHLDELVRILQMKEISYPIAFTNTTVRKIDHDMNTFDERMRVREIKENAQLSKPLLDEFIHMYATQLKSSVDDTVYEIEPVFSDKYGQWVLSFKVGNAKKYMIKSIGEFLRYIDDRKEITYGKSLSFVHSEDKFNEDAQESIRFMRKYMAKMQANHFDQNVKLIQLIDNELDDFFSLYENCEELPFVLETIAENIVVDVSIQGDYYVFHNSENKEYQFGKKNIYYNEHIVKTDIIYRIKLDEQGITALFLNRLYKNDIVIHKDDYAKFYQYVLMIAMQYLDIKLPTELEDEQMVSAELYGDINEQGRIYFYLYCYNESHTRYDGFDTNRLIGYDQVLIESYIRKYASEVDEAKHIVYMDENEESTMDFISEGLPYLSKYCQIYVSEALKSIGKTQHYSIQIGVKFSNDLLALSIDTPDIPREELAALLASYKRRKKFYRLKNGKLLSLQSDDLAQLSSFLDEYQVSNKDLQKSKIELEPYRMFALNEAVDKQDVLQINREKSFIKHVNQYFETKEFKLPTHYDAILRDYQKEGFQWLSVLRQYKFNGILADDMGLGKTLQVIALLEANKSQCSMVVCPASLIYNWEEEVHKFTDNVSLLCITGTQEERKERIQRYKEYDVFVTSYDYIRRDIEYYEDIQFDTVILDEAQYIKNQKTKNATSVKRLHAHHRLALSGTPIENSLAELWSIFDFLMPNYLFNYHYFQKQYENDIVKGKDEKKQKELQKLVSPFILRRNKKDVLKELPDKIETLRKIDFTPDEKKLYLANVAEVNDQLSKMDDSKNNKIMILAMLTKLRQLCCEPRLVYENINQMSSKLMDCMELLEELHANHQKVLLFSAFTSILDLLADELKRKQISFYQLTGSTNKEDRKELVRKFQEDDTSVFLISLKAGGTGLNLTAAEAVIHFDPWWNQSAQNQATDRAYRIGQHKNVQVFKMIMRDSIEERIIKLQEQKKALADAFVENNDGAIASMSKDEIMELFKV